MFHIFKIPTARVIAERQLKEAERQMLDHRARAESHKALAEEEAIRANMYEDRIERLHQYLQPTPPFPDGMLADADRSQRSSKITLYKPA